MNNKQDEYLYRINYNINRERLQSNVNNILNQFDIPLYTQISLEKLLKKKY